VKKIGVIGSGSMGAALMSGWTNSGVGVGVGVDTVAVVRDIEKHRHLEVSLGIEVTKDRKALFECDVVVIAIKPQLIKEILHEFQPFIAPNATVISVAVGITTEFLGNCFPQTVEIVKAMPNTPSQIHMGVTCVSGGQGCSEESIAIAVQLLSTVGDVFVVPESQQAAVGAVSGSGPAYLFYLAQYLQQGAQELGLDADLADQLIRATLRGSAELLARSDSAASDLRRQVTSPGGTTQAAMEVLAERRVAQAIGAALAAGAARSTELGKS
jgi:pyrroline-5-carboxylate reductase